jgi:hypothetical protein
MEKRSMVYTEYFVRGTQPAEICGLHSPSFTDRLAGIFGKDVAVPVSAADVGLPPAAATSGAPATPTAVSADASKAPQVEEPKKKRGFWTRVFGRSDDDKKKDEERKKEEERKKAEERRAKGG